MSSCECTQQSLGASCHWCVGAVRIIEVKRVQDIFKYEWTFVAIIYCLGSLGTIIWNAHGNQDNCRTLIIYLDIYWCLKILLLWIHNVINNLDVRWTIHLFDVSMHLVVLKTSRNGPRKPGSDFLLLS